MKITRETFFKLATAVSALRLTEKQRQHQIYKTHPLMKKTLGEIETEEEAQEAFNLFMDLIMEKE